MLRKAFLVILLFSAPTLGFAQARTAAPSVEGVWRIAEVVTTGANPASNSSPQPSLIMFTSGHYSYLSANRGQPVPKLDPPKDPKKLTDAEKIARYEHWAPFTAQAGTYELKGTTLTRRALVAKNEVLVNLPSVQEFKLEGNTLWLISKSAAGQPASETRTKLIRVP